MSDELTITLLIMGIVTLLISVPQLTFAMLWFNVAERPRNFPMWERLCLVATAGALLSLAFYGISQDVGTLSADAEALVSAAPAAVMGFYGFALWAVDTFGQMQGHDASQSSTRVGERIGKLAMLPVTAAPVIIPYALLWG